MKKLIKSEIEVIARKIITELKEEAKKTNNALFKTKKFKKAMKDLWESDPGLVAIKGMKKAEVELIGKLLGAEGYGSTSYGKASQHMVIQILNTTYIEPINIETNGSNYGSYNFISEYDPDFRNEFDLILESLGYIDIAKYNNIYNELVDEIILTQIACKDLESLIITISKKFK